MSATDRQRALAAAKEVTAREEFDDQVVVNILGDGCREVFRYEDGELVDYVYLWDSYTDEHEELAA